MLKNSQKKIPRPKSKNFLLHCELIDNDLLVI